MSTYYVYILASKKNGTLYIGVTNNLIRRVYEHRNGLIEGFTKKYGVNKLVYYEQTEDIKSAIERGKRLKKWKRQWKIELIEKMNPMWKDLYDELKRLKWIPAFAGMTYTRLSLPFPRKRKSSLFKVL
jgi:putative endonuclease